MALPLSMAWSIPFYFSVRARVSRDDPEGVKAHGVDADQFTAFMDDVARVRNVSEHWADAINPRKLKSHAHVSRDNLKLGVDETSLIVMGPTEIYVGPLNVHDVYLYITEIVTQLKPPPIPQPEPSS